MVATILHAWLWQIYNQGVNSRFYHGFQCEDHVGRICDALCVSQKVKLEHTALETWYIGLLDHQICVPSLFLMFFVFRHT